ncbi:MAG: FAD-binding protein [Bacteriovoracaceae bacterium]|jgi:uncharacterized protein|nr:FAD-binding protein [Bacteriovoracaceae bacterium]
MGKRYQSDVTIVGGGIAGIVTALSILDSPNPSIHSKKILLLDRDGPSKLGGLAKISFAGITMFDSPVQRRSGIKDNQEQAFADWLSICLIFMQ